MNRKLTANMLWLCIDEYDGARISGTLHSIMQKEPMIFHDFHQMILQADTLFDEIGYPQSFQTKRTLLEEEEKKKEFHRLGKEPVRDSDDITPLAGKQRTFALMVNTRQYTNWQGFIFQKDFVRLAEFKDILELMEIIMKQCE